MGVGGFEQESDAIDPVSRGPWLAFTVLQGKGRDIYIVQRDGRGLRNVTRGRGKNIWPAWSADGQRLAYASNRDGNWEIYSMTLADLKETRMTRTPEREGAPAWSPMMSGGPCDGRGQISNLSPPDAPMSPGPAQPLSKPEGCFGDRVVFLVGEENHREIYLMDADGQRRTRLTYFTGDKVAAAWSPDGKTVAFESNATGHWEIYRVDVEGGNPVRLTAAPADNETPVWSPDGKKIAFESNRDGNWEIYAMSADGSNPIRLTRMAGAESNPTWSPDGDRLAFESIQQGKGEIFVVNVESQEIENLTNHPANDNAPQWSPDGKQIAFSSDRDGTEQIYVMDPDGSQLTRLTQLEGESKWPYWSP
ncbi:MAG: PD40 domain-containing protein [Nitrospirae bacterium]|nr:PD40 domain-containing protein [Nitrospirota bacterium]